MNNQKYYETTLQKDLPNYLKRIKQLKELPEIPRRVLACFLGDNLPIKIYDTNLYYTPDHSFVEPCNIWFDRPLYESILSKLFYYRHLYSKNQRHYLLQQALTYEHPWVLDQQHRYILFIKVMIFKILETQWLSFNHLNYPHTKEFIVALADKLIDGTETMNVGCSSNRVYKLHIWLTKWVDKLYIRYVKYPWKFKKVVADFFIGYDLNEALSLLHADIGTLDELRYEFDDSWDPCPLVNIG